jgi:hypothetical protein
VYEDENRDVIPTSRFNPQIILVGLRSMNMSEFMYLFRGSGPSGSPEEMQQQMQKWAAWAKELSSNGHLRGGDPLDRTGKVLLGADKAVTEGPFAQAKDVVGGYMLIEAEDLIAAAELSASCPIFATGGSVEIRPVLKMNA